MNESPENDVDATSTVRGLSFPRATLACWAICGVLGASPPVRAADSPSVRLGSITLSPVVFDQLDLGTTFDAGQAGGPKLGTQGGFDPRRLRLGVNAKADNGLGATFVWDFGGIAGSRSRLFEADVSYSGLKPVTFRIGAFKPLVTAENSQSAANILFISRAAIANLVSNLGGGAGREGIEATIGAERWFGNLAVTGGRAAPVTQGRQRAVLGRATGLLVDDGDRKLTLGVSGVWVFRPPDGTQGPELSLSSRPELTFSSQSFVRTGSIPSSSISAIGPEASFGVGKLWAQGEYYHVSLHETGVNAGQRNFSGWYAQASWTLLGNPRKWTSASGSWSSPSSSEEFNPLAGNWGAVELGARYSTLDLDDGPVHGGHQNVWSTDLSWYPAKPLRFIAEYQYADIDHIAVPRRFQAVELRAQLSF